MAAGPVLAAAAQPDGTTPLHWAIYHVDYDLIQALLDKQANPNVTNAFGAAPIAEAVELVDTRMVKMLLDHGALAGLPRSWKDPQKFLYDAAKGPWAHEDKLGPNVV
jgi:ankyrin repeat protein